MSTKGRWKSGKFEFYDGYETVKPMSPVVFEEDFLGAYLQKYTANENTTPRWKTTETSLDTAIGLVDDGVNGIAQVAVGATDRTELAALHFGDNQQFSLKQGLMMEFRATFHGLPTTGSEVVTAVMGLAGAHHGTTDSVATNVWF